MSVLTSRKFWVAVLAVGVIIAQAFLPGFEFESEEAAGFIIIIVSFLVGLAIDPGAGWAGLLRSRKFWSAVVGLLLVFLRAFQVALPFELTADQLVAACTALGGYIVAVALELKVRLPVPVGDREEFPAGDAGAAEG